MSNSSSPPKSQPAYLEDFSEDTNTVLPGTRQTANVAAKRSRPDFSNKLVAAEKGRDAAGTDSGYSSQAGATVGTRSAPSEESKLRASPISPRQIRGSAKRISIGAEMATSSRQGSPEKSSLRRTVSRSQKKENLRQDALESRESAARIRLSGAPVEAPSVPRQAAAEQQPERQQRLRHTGPPSPQSTRPPRTTEGQVDPMIRPATARPRPTPTQGHHPRPLSYHEGIPPQGPPAPNRRPESLYIQTFSYQGPPQPVAYVATPLSTSPQRQAAYPFPATAFAPPYQPPQGPWVEPVRTASSRRNSMYSARLPIDHSPVHQLYPAPYQQPAMARRLSVHRASPVAPLEQGSYFVEESPEGWYRNDRLAMPPPPVPNPSTRAQARPSLKHAATTSTAHPSLHHRRSDRDAPDSNYETSFRKLSLDEPRPASRPSMSSRPSAMSSITIGYGKHSPATSPNDDRAPMPPSAMKHTRRQSNYGPDEREREREAEAYQEAQSSGLKPVPLTAEVINKVMRRRSKTSGGSGSGSHAGSRAGSSREGSDVKVSKTGSRSSMDKHRGGGGSEVRIRQDEGSGLTLTINGAHQGMQLGLKSDGVDGRTISFRPGNTRDGQVEVRIGSRSAVSSRDRSTTDRNSTKYRYSGSSKPLKEIGPAEYSSRRRSRSRAAGDVIVEKGKSKADDKIAEGDVLERLRRETRPGSRSRRNSRVDVIRSGMTEGGVRRETPEGQFF